MLYLVTDRKSIKKGTLYDVVRNAIMGGVDAVILREKDLTEDELYPMAVEIREITKEKGVPLIINQHIDVAKAVGADGIHLAFHEYMKKKVDFKGLIGVSVHSLEEATTVEGKGASYILAGHVFETNCKKGIPPRGIQFIEKLLAHVTLPVIAIGGIHFNNIGELLSINVKGCAVMSLIMAAEDSYDVAKKLKNKMEEYGKRKSPFE